MAVPRSSAPVFGRYAGVQGVQSWHSCVGAPSDVGFRPVFSSVAGRGELKFTDFIKFLESIVYMKGRCTLAGSIWIEQVCAF